MSAQHLINIYRKEVMIACVHFYVFFTLFLTNVFLVFRSLFLFPLRGIFAAPRGNIFFP